MATALLAALLGGCSFLSKEADATEVSSEAETESPGATQESETETTETEETQESHEAAEDEESGEEETEDHFVEKKIVVATDMHYFAEKLAGNRCDSFVGMARGGDGRVLEYGWEVMDAFLDDMKEEDPDLLILSGDLTLDGEKFFTVKYNAVALVSTYNRVHTLGMSNKQVLCNYPKSDQDHITNSYPNGSTHSLNPDAIRQRN